MGGSYRQCSECGKRALSIATRCPGCGRELEPQAAPEARSAMEVGRDLPQGVVAAVILGGIVLAVEFGGEMPSDSPGLSSAGRRQRLDRGLVRGGVRAWSLGAAGQRQCRSDAGRRNPRRRDLDQRAAFAEPAGRARGGPLAGRYRLRRLA